MTDTYSKLSDAPKTPMHIPDILQSGGTVGLHKLLTYEQIEEIHKIFLKNNNAITYLYLREVLKEFNILLTDTKYLALFLKLNVDSNNIINWDEFVTYMIFCFQEDDPLSEKESLILPISEEPVVKDANHIKPITCMTILHSINAQEDDKDFGYYITASNDGSINFLCPDLELKRKSISKSHYLKYTPTWVLCIAALSDVHIICVSSTERELRFYDVKANTFHLRVVIRSVPYAIGTMSYCYSLDGANSKLLLGDLAGNLRILEFSPILRGPFKSSTNSILIELSWSEILKGNLPDMYVTEYLNLFRVNITQVFYSYKLDTAYVSAADKSGLIAIDSRGTKNHFYIPQGVSTFYLDEHNLILATGGPDTFVRLWEPYVSSKASMILDGHRSGIVYIFIQHNEQLCYSIDIMKTIKVWHIIDKTIIQTFSDLRILTNEKQFCYKYNRVAHELLIAGRQIISIKCCAKMELSITDGNTHAAPVSVVLYNKLFDNIVTCGLDSYIIVWDIWTGKRKIIMKKCHTMDLMGEIIDVEITAAAFDPSQQYLITGARDGSIKIWNYNNAVCTRNLNIEDKCEVTGIFWIPDRILVVGWNRCVTQFADIKGLEYSDGINWLEIHKTDITAAACKQSEVLVTGSYFGILVFWKAETGQPYRKHKVKYPQKFYDLYADRRDTYDEQLAGSEKSSIANRVSVGKAMYKRMMGLSDTISDSDPANSLDKNTFKSRYRRPTAAPKLKKNASVEKLYLELNLCIQAVLILDERPVSKDHGNVLVALDNGWIQVYSSHETGGYIREFHASHKGGDCVNSMTTDKNNIYLFTGTSFGYIKIWLLQNYCIPKSEHTPVSKPLLRLQFFFLSDDRIKGRAKRIAKDNEPLLLSSHKAHLRSIISIIYLDVPKIIITGSHDYSVRIWTLGGRYINTFGSVVPQKQLVRNDINNEYEELNDFRVPPDIHKVASSTTMKVLTGIITDHLCVQLEKHKELHPNISNTDTIVTKLQSVHGFDCKKNCYNWHKVHQPILGKHFKIMKTCHKKDIPILDKSLPYIPVYSHIKINQIKKVINLTTFEDTIKKYKNLQFNQKI